jgi:hypothetical protein
LPCSVAGEQSAVICAVLLSGGAELARTHRKLAEDMPAAPAGLTNTIRWSVQALTPQAPQGLPWPTALMI